MSGVINLAALTRIAEILHGLQVPSGSGYYHLSTAYEPYQKLMGDFGFKDGRFRDADTIFAALRKGLWIDEPKPPIPEPVSPAANYSDWDDYD